MRDWLIIFLRALGLCLIACLLAPVLASAQSPDVADLAARVNRERLARGLVPYALNAQLTKSAQAHANDIASNGNYSHIGADGSTVFDRAARAGYGAYSWGRRLGENWAWYQNAATAVAEWMDSPPHRDNILHPLYREIGIGIAPSRGNTIFVVDFGAQPNALPFFIDAAASATRSANVMLTFSSEDVMPNGDGADTLGHATQVQIANTANFAGARWLPFAREIPWTLSPGGGTRTVYVKYRDAKGRTATASDSILSIAPPTATFTRTRQPTRTRTATPSDTPTITATETLEPTETPSPTETAAAPIDPPTPTASPTPEAAPAQNAQSIDPFALGAFGAAVMLGILATVKYFVSRT
ncbi:MAG: CAP domain-containing protein [Chloroflexota bacterium]|nr:CAP domain-containing protein [Chloroflexota bacterium]